MYSPADSGAADVLFANAELKIVYSGQTINTISTQIVTLKKSTNLGLTLKDGPYGP